MNRDVLITDFADDKKFARGWFDIIVIVIVLLCVLLCIACVCVRVYRSGKWRIVEDKMEEMFHILHLHLPKREDVVESFATRFAAARGGSGRRVCCQRCEEVFF